MKTLEKIDNVIQELEWFDSQAPNGEGIGKVEARLGSDSESDSQKLAIDFEDAFGDLLDDFLVDNRGDWTNYLLGISDNEAIDPFVKNLLNSYQEMLDEAEIDEQYGGACRCKNWSRFLQFTFGSMWEGLALYSPLLFSIKERWVIYVHRTGEIGIYFPKWTPNLSQILKNIESNGGSWHLVRAPTVESRK